MNAANVCIVRTPHASGPSVYGNHRPPLVSSPLLKLPLGAVRPGGWLKHQLDLMADGMTGRLGEVSKFLGPENGWFGGDGEGWEEQPYWLRGFYSLAALSGRENLLTEVPAMGWPWYAENLWQATADGGLAAWLYAAGEVEAKVGASGGPTVKISAETNYPFEERVRLKIEGAAPAKFPLYLRVPGWCRRFRVKINGAMVDAQPAPGEYVRLEKSWMPGDAVELELPAELTVTRWPRTGAATVERGPLSYSVNIKEKRRRCGGSDAWPEWEYLPASPWNYGLALDRRNPAAGLEFQAKDATPAQPWTPETAPLEIRARVRRIPAWSLEYETVEELQPSPIKTAAPEETITMIPLGCARLRLACLPVAGDGPDAREWQTKKNLKAEG
jgi:hypothetical protein